MEPQLEGCGKDCDIDAADVVAPASMEPQLEGCGKHKAAQKYRALVRMLQWSRNLRVAERTCLQARVVRYDASMEPQLEGCGKFATCSAECRQIRLQWSRNLRVAERVDRQGVVKVKERLQWSRNLRVAESRPS